MPLASIRRTVMIASLATFVAMTAARAEDTASSPPAEKAPAPSAKSQVEAGKTREMPLAFRTQATECHRYRPTGSHIAAVRCETKDAAESAHARALRELAKSDLDEIRRRQMTQELVRQQALAGAINRVGH
jgi:hypothetical protein